MKISVGHQQCEWCERVATHRFTATDRQGYRRYSCGAPVHTRGVEDLLAVDGIEKFELRISSEPFIIGEENENQRRPPTVPASH